MLQASFGSASTSIECTMESLLERKRMLEFTYQNRKKKLEHVLKIRQWEDEVDQVKPTDSEPYRFLSHTYFKCFAA